MSLRDEIQADIAEAFNDDLADVVYSFTCERTTKSSWNPVTETYTEVKVNYSGRGVLFGKYSAYEISSLGIEATDKKATLLQNEVTNTPLINDVLAQSGDYSKSAQSGDYSKSAQSGYYSQSAQSGDYSQSAQSGDYSKSAQSGNNSKSAQSGDNSKSAQSGNNSCIELLGKNCVGANIGINGKIKGVKGSWITLAEYNENGICICVKSAKITGKALKADTWYTLKNGKFMEVMQSGS